MSNTTFKVGDLVKCLKDFNGRNKVGNIYKVIDVNHDGWIDICCDGKEGVRICDPVRFALIPKEEALQHTISLLEKELSAVVEFKVGDIVFDCDTGVCGKIKEIGEHLTELEEGLSVYNSSMVQASQFQVIQYKIEQTKKELAQIEKDKEFKVGDYIVCVDVQSATQWLKVDFIYKITEVSQFYVWVDGDGGYNKERFIKATQEQIDEYIAKQPLLKTASEEDQLDQALATLKLLMKQEGSVKGYVHYGFEIYYGQQSKRLKVCGSSTASTFPIFKTQELALQAILNIGEERLIRMFRVLSGDFA